MFRMCADLLCLLAIWALLAVVGVSVHDVIVTFGITVIGLLVAVIVATDLFLLRHDRKQNVLP